MMGFGVAHAACVADGVMRSGKAAEGLRQVFDEPAVNGEHLWKIVMNPNPNKSRRCSFKAPTG